MFLKKFVICVVLFMLVCIVESFAYVSVRGSYRKNTGTYVIHIIGQILIGTFTTIGALIQMLIHTQAKPEQEITLLIASIDIKF